jgi:hypothetical protein
MGFVASAALSVWILLGLGGWDYYRTPLTVRGYAPAHRMLRPSGPFGQTFGVVGVVLILVPFLYLMRKRFVRRQWAGSIRGWLEVHLFCGIVGPVLVTFHTAFKFNGIVSAAYWSMMLVALSGFVGRYLYVRSPRTIKGTELTRAELDGRAEDLLAELRVAGGGGAWLNRVHAIELASVPAATGRRSIAGLLFGELALRWRLRGLAHDFRKSGLPAEQRHELLTVVRDRILLLRRTAFLHKTKAAFGMWHMFHLPFVYVLIVIVSVHVGVALYLGYVPFRWS